MTNLGILIIIIAALITMILLWFVGIYNGLIRLKNRTDEAWSDIDVQLKRRHDLIPNLVATVKGYMQHEAGTLEKVTAARALALNAGSIAEKGQTENALSGALKSLLMVAESYPELKASQNFLQLQDELSDTENKIMAARRFYNGMVRDFNTGIQTFPANLAASLLAFKKFDFFQAEEGEKQNVEVKF